MNPDEFVPALANTAWYAYRRTWAATKNKLGWEGNSNAHYVGDWSTRTGATRDRVYAGLSARSILAVAEGKTFVEATAELPDIAAIKASAGLKPIDLANLKKR